MLVLSVVNNCMLEQKKRIYLKDFIMGVKKVDSIEFSL